MKRLLLSLSVLMAGTFASFGQEASEKPVYNETTQVGYEDLKSAWDDASDGAVLVMNQDQTISSRLDLNSRAITLKGANSAIRILRSSSFLKGSLIIPLKASGLSTGGTITYENLVFDGENQDVNGSVLEAANNGNVIMKNVKFVNCKNIATSGNQGLISVKGGGNLVVENLKTENCSLGEEGKGEIFIGAWCPFKVIGDCQFSVFLDSKSSNLRVQDVTNTAETPIVIFINTSVIEENYNLFRTDAGVAFSGCYEMGTPGYKIGTDAKGNHVVVKDESTAVNLAKVNAGNRCSIYSIQGVKVKENTLSEQALDNLAPGIYIVNGKKVVKH